MKNEVEAYVGELKELREKVRRIEQRENFIRQRIQWLDSDIRMNTNSDWEKNQKREMKEFLESLLEPKKTMRVSGVPYEVDL
jgi:hypothetical protein